MWKYNSRNIEICNYMHSVVNCNGTSVCCMLQTCSYSAISNFLNLLNWLPKVFQYYNSFIYFSGQWSLGIHYKQALMWLVISREVNFLIILVYLNSTIHSDFLMSALGFLNEFTRIPRWIHSDSLMNTLRFLNEFIWIPQWIHMDSSMNSIKFLN